MRVLDSSFFCEIAFDGFSKMQVNGAKALAMLTLGLGSFIAGMIPAWFSDRVRQRYPLLISSLLCFGGGVLLSTSLIHMLPEAREKLPNHSELTLCLGFFLVYLVDELVHVFYGTQNTDRPHSNQNYGSTERNNLLPVSESQQRVEGEEARRCCGDAGNPRMCHVSHTPPCNKSASGMIGLFCALFVHSVLEGLAIGLQQTASEVLLLLGAVSSHKYVVGFCLGAELVASLGERKAMHLACILIFSLASVAGIALGAGLEVISAIENSLAVPIMQALAAGTLLYVTVSEVLPRERASWHGRRRAAGLLQLGAVLAGFALMYVTTLYLDAD